jgi:hypothetical protein
MATGGSLSRVKRPGPEADHSPSTSAEVKKMWLYTFTSPCAFMGYVRPSRRRCIATNVHAIKKKIYIYMYKMGQKPRRKITERNSQRTGPDLREERPRLPPLGLHKREKKNGTDFTESFAFLKSQNTSLGFSSYKE